MPGGGYRFGPFRFAIGERIFYRGVDPFPLTPKAAETLYHLLDRHGALIEKSELMQLVWPRTFVEEATLAGIHGFRHRPGLHLRLRVADASQGDNRTD